MQVGDISLIGQSESMCGPASLVSILSFYGIQTTEAELAKLCRSDMDGTWSAAILDAARVFGLDGYVYDNSTWEMLALALEDGPVIVNWTSGGVGHYSVAFRVIGDEVLIADPEGPMIRTMSKTDFLSVWFDSDPNVPLNTYRRIIVIRRLGTGRLPYPSVDVHLEMERLHPASGMRKLK